MSSMKRRQELSGIHVVVIDDDDDARTIMKMVLEAHGAFVMVAASARDGLATLGQVAPDVLLVDLTILVEWRGERRNDSGDLCWHVILLFVVRNVDN